jgi:hypothetical protein
VAEGFPSPAFIFGRIDNQTDAAIVLLLDQVVIAQFGRPAIFAQEALTLLGLDPAVVRSDGAPVLRPVLETLSTAEPNATATGIRQLRDALKKLGSPRRLRALPSTSETAQRDRLKALAVKAQAIEMHTWDDDPPSQRKRVERGWTAVQAISDRAYPRWPIGDERGRSSTLGSAHSCPRAGSLCCSAARITRSISVATRRWPVTCRRGHHGVQTRGARAADHGIEDERHASAGTEPIGHRERAQHSVVVVTRGYSAGTSPMGVSSSSFSR